MSTQPEFDFERGPARRAEKAVADTSREAYADLAPTVQGRRLRVLRALAAHNRAADPPTAYELLEWMRRWVPSLDLNSVRPRITELAGDRLVESSGKRACRVSGKTAYTWRLTPRGEVAVREGNS